MKTPQQQSKAGGYMFLFAGGAFFVAAAIGGNGVFFGLGGAFIAIGASMLLQARKGL